MRPWKAGSALGLCLTVAVLALVNCGVPSDKALNDGQHRIDVLKSKGVPDSALSQAIVYLYQAREAKAKDNRGLASKSADSMRLLIGKAESEYEENLRTLKPVMDSVIGVLNQARKELTGVQLHRLDSAMAVIDSLYKLNWIYQVQSNARIATNVLLKALQFNEARTREVAPRLPGVWVCVNKITSDAFKEVNGTERLVFDFRKDSTGSLTQSKSGQTGKALKEDWNFIYSGKYEIGGDTILLHVTRFQSTKEHFEEGVVGPEGKVVEWRKRDGTPTDSVIADGQYDRSVTFTDLTTDFKQEKKY
jgi:hypothetical protein